MSLSHSLLSASSKLLLPQLSSIFRRCRKYESVEVPVPTMGESITEGSIQVWNKRVGENVEADEVVAVIDTDKISIDVNSPVAGKLVSIEANDGDTVYVGSKLFVVDTEGGDGGESTSTAEATTSASNVDEMVQPPSASPPPGGVPQAPVEKKVAMSSVDASDQRREDVSTMSRMRQRIAERLKSAQSEGVLLTTFQECDMSAVMALRKKLGPIVMDKLGVKIGFMSFFIKASAMALKEWPGVNAVLDGKSLIAPNYVDISVAVATPTGLTVPVIRDVECKSIIQLEQELAGLAGLARKGKLNLEQMAGGTFTVSNGGIYGSLMGTPIINPPQSGILGMHSIVQRPVVRDGQIVIRPVMYLALTYDHRVVDGKEGVSFLKMITDLIEQPERILIGV